MALSWALIKAAVRLSAHNPEKNPLAGNGALINAPFCLGIQAGEFLLFAWF